MKVKLSEIYIPERLRREGAKLSEMALSLTDKGQIQPILVREPREDEADEIPDSKRWVLVAGGRRVGGAIVAGWEEIEAWTRDDIEDELTHYVLELHENLDREDMTFQEVAAAKKRLAELRRLQNPDITDAEIASEIGDNASSFSRDLQAAEILEQRPELAKASSRKAVLRADKLARQLEAKKREKDLREAVEEGIEDRMVTADMREWLANLAESSVDLMLVDPPYGQDVGTSAQKNVDTTSELSSFDDSLESAVALWEETFPLMVRVTRATGWILLFSNTDSVPIMRELIGEICSVHYGYALDKEERKALRCSECPPDESCTFLQPEKPAWIWYRPNSRNSPRYPERTAKNMYEYILPVNMGKALLTRPSENVLVVDANYSGSRIHMNQKPVDLYKELIERCSGQAEIVADPCFGSGAALAAAAATGRIGIGCELNEALRDPAMGLVAQFFKPITLSDKKTAEIRLKQKMEKLNLEDEDD